MKGFIILSHPRSGTSYFAQGVLAKHPEIICYGELFNSTDQTKRLLNEYGLNHFDDQIYRNSKRFKEPLKFLNTFRNKVAESSDKSFLGFKLFPEQLFDFEIITLSEKWPIIFLRRENIAQSAVSYEIAKVTGQWNKSQENAKTRFEANIPRMLKFARKYTFYLNNYKQYLVENNINHLSLSYENLFTYKALDEVNNFLGLSEPFPKSFEFADTKLNSAERYKELITNIQEVREEFIARNYGDLFD